MSIYAWSRWLLLIVTLGAYGYRGHERAGTHGHAVAGDCHARRDGGRARHLGHGRDDDSDGRAARREPEEAAWPRS